LPLVLTPVTSLQDQFHESFARLTPLLFVDLHEKHDNRFRLDPRSVDWLDEMLRERYERLPDPSLPWVSFYRLKKSNPASALKFTPQPENPILKTIHLQNLSSLLLKPQLWPKSFRLAQEIDPLFRAWISLNLLPEDYNSALRLKMKAVVQNKIQVINSLLDDGVPPVFTEDSEKDFTSEVTTAFTQQGWDPPLPLAGRSWWVSMALTELQP
jgi:hypothetical protein